MALPLDLFGVLSQANHNNDYIVKALVFTIVILTRILGFTRKTLSITALSITTC